MAISFSASAVQNFTTSSIEDAVDGLASAIDAKAGVWSVTTRGDNRAAASPSIEVSNSNGNCTVVIAGDSAVAPATVNTGGSGNYYPATVNHLFAGICPEGKAVSDVNYTEPFTATVTYPVADAASPRWGDGSETANNGGLVGLGAGGADDGFIIADEGTAADDQIFAAFVRTGTSVRGCVLGSLFAGDTEAASSQCFGGFWSGGNIATNHWTLRAQDQWMDSGFGTGTAEDKGRSYRTSTLTNYDRAVKVAAYHHTGGQMKGIRTGAWHFYPVGYISTGPAGGSDAHVGYLRQMRMGPDIEHRRFLEDASSNVLAIAVSGSTSSAVNALYFMNDSLIP